MSHTRKSIFKDAKEKVKDKEKVPKESVSVSEHGEGVSIHNDINIVIDVQPNQEDDAVSGCFKSLMKCMK